MRVLFFAQVMPDPCGAFFHDIILARSLQARGHSVHFITVGAKFPRKGVFRGIPFSYFEVSGNEMQGADIYCCPHYPFLPFVRKLNERYEKPIAVTMHYGEDTDAIANCKRSGNWAEFLWFVSPHIQEKVSASIKISPSFIETGIVRPTFIENEISMGGAPTGECITLINANVLKGVQIFIELAKRFPDRKFLGVKPYYNKIIVPTDLKNIEWIDIQDDIRTVLSKTRILVVPSAYESWGRVAFEAMYNGIPVLYTKPVSGASGFKTGSTEGMRDWIQDNGIQCDRTTLDDWVKGIQGLDDPEVYADYSERAIKCTREMDIFSEIPRIEGKLFEFSKKFAAPNKSKGEDTPVAAPRKAGVNRFMGGAPAVPRIAMRVGAPRIPVTGIPRPSALVLPPSHSAVKR
jgi:hypothetical protein